MSPLSSQSIFMCFSSVILTVCRRKVSVLYKVPYFPPHIFSHNNLYTPAAAAKSLQSCPTLCDPIDGSPPGSSVHGIFQARVLEWGAIAFSRPIYWKIVKSSGPATAYLFQVCILISFSYFRSQL